MLRSILTLLFTAGIFSVFAQTSPTDLSKTTKTIAGFTVSYEFPANATVTINGAQPSQAQASLVLNSNGNVSKASFSITDTNTIQYTYGAFTLNIEHITYDAKDDHLICSGNILMPTEFQEDTNAVYLNFSSLRLNAQGIVDLGNVHLSSPIQYHGFYYGLGSHHKIYKDSLVLDGYIVLPHNIGQLHTSMRLEANQNATLELDSVKDNKLKAYGYEFDVLNASYSQGVWTLNTDLVIPDDFGKLRANQLKVDTSGIVQDPTFDVSKSPQMQMGVYKAKATDAWLSDNKLMMKAEFYLWNETLSMDSLTILNSGDIDCKYVTASSSQATIAGFAMDSIDFDFGYYVIDSLANQKYGFQLNGRVSLPNNWGQVKVNNARIYLDGSFDGGHATDKDSINLNGFKFHLDEGRFFPSIHYYTLSGTVQSHADTSIAQIFVDGEVVGYRPVINGSWSIDGIRHPALSQGHIKVINIIDNDKDGEYNFAKDAIFDISEKVIITPKSGALGHFKGASNRPNGDLISVSHNGQALGTAVVWDGHWEYFAYGLPALSQGDIKAMALRKSDGYRISAQSLNNIALVDIEYKGKSLGKVLVKSDGSFQSPIYQIHNFIPADIKVLAYEDSDTNGIIEPNKDVSTDITSSVTLANPNKRFYKIFGKSSQANGSVVNLKLSGSDIGQALVWDGHWRLDYETQQSVTTSALKALVYTNLKMDSLLEGVSSGIKAQAIVLNEEDFSHWMEFHSITTDSIGLNNSTILLDGELALPKFGKMPVEGMNISSSGMRMPGKKNSHGNPHFRFDGYNYNLNSFDIDVSKPMAILDGEIILPDNAGRLWAKVDAQTSGVGLSSMELEQKEITIGDFIVHVDSLSLNTKEEMQLQGELDIPNMDRYLPVDKLTISATTERKEAEINTDNLIIKTNGYQLQVSKARFVVDTLPGGAFADTMMLSGIIDLGAMGNLNATDLRFDSYGNIVSGNLSVGDKGLKVNGFDFSNATDSIRFVHNEIHISKIDYLIPGKNASIVFRHILIDNELNFEVDEVSLAATSYDYNGYTLTVDNMAWKSDQLLVGGILSLGGDLGNTEIDNIEIKSDGSLNGGEFNLTQTTMSYHGFNLTIDTVVLDEQDVMTMSGNIVLPDSLGEIKLDGLKVNAQKVLDYGTIDFSTDTVTWLGFQATIDSLEFKEPYFHLGGNVTVPKMGTLRLSDLKLDASGKFSGGTFILPDSAKVDYNGFEIAVSTIDIESDGVELDGSIKLPNQKGTIQVTGLEITGQGSFSQGHFLYEEGSNPMEFDSLHLEINSVDIENNKLYIHAALELPNNVGRVGAHLSWDMNQDIQLDSISLRNANITYSGFHINLTNCQYTNNNFVFDGTISVDNLGVFKVDQLSLSSQGGFSGGSVSFQGTTWQWGSLAAKINNASIVNHEILLDADVTLPNNMGTLGLKNVDVDMNGKIISAKVTLDSLSYAGYTFHLDSASVTNNNLITLAGYMKLPKGYGKITIDNFSIGTDGNIVAGEATYEGQGITLAQTNITVDKVHLSNSSLGLDGTIHFPSAIGGSLDFSGLEFSTSGNISINSIAANNVAIQIQGFSANLSSVSWDKSQQRVIIDSELSLPGTFGNTTITNLQIGTDGKLYGGSFDLSGLNMDYHGVSLKPTLLEINGNELTANCELTLPNNAQLSVAGMKIGPSGISDFGQINASNVKFQWKGYDFELSQLNFSNDIFSFSGKLDFGKYGSLDAKDIQISTSGDFYGGTFVPSNAQLKFASMDISLDSLVFQQNEFEFSGSMTLPSNNGKIIFRDIDLTTDGKFTGGSLIYDGNGFSFDDGKYRVVPSDFTLNSDNSITLDARVIEVATDSVKAIMTGTKITGDPFNIQFGTETLLNTEFYYKGFDVKVDTFTVSGTDITYTGHITIPKLGKLDVAGLVMDVSSGKITDHGNITYTGQTWTMGSTSFTIDSVKLEEDYIDIQAKMQLPNNAGEVDVNNMRLSTTGSLLSADVDVQNISMGYHNYTIALTHAQIEGGELELDGTINLNTFGTFNVEDLEFDLENGTFKQATLTSENADFALGSFTATPQSIAFVNGTIDIDGFLQLPNIFGDSASVSFDGLKIGTDGSFNIDSVKSNNLEVQYKGFDLAFTELQWSDGLTISADLTLPGNSQTISLESLKVDQNGNVSGGSLNANGVSIAYHGYTLELQSAEFLPGDGAKLSGSFTLPGGTVSLSVTDLQFGSSGITDFGTVAMSSTEPVKWHDFEVNVSNVSVSDGTVLIDGSMGLNGIGTLTVSQLGFTSSGNFLPGDITLDNQKQLTFGQYSATISTIEFSDNVITVDGEIGLSGNRKVAIFGMSIDFQGNFSGGSLTYSGDPISFSGSKITPYGISFENSVLTASAQMVLPDDLATVTATDVSIDHNFNVSVGEVEVEGVSIHYKGIIVNLDSAIYQGSDLSLWGNIQNDKLGNLKVTGLTMNTSGVITGGAVDYSGTQYFGQLEVNITDLGFDWGQGDITLSGSLILPSNVGTLTVDTIVLDPHSGALKSGTLSATSPITYGGVGIEQISATIDDSKVELGGTATLPDQLGTISVAGLDINLDNSNFSGGTFTYQEEKPITFGGASVSITSLSFNLSEIDLSAQIQLPANLGQASVNDAKFVSGKFSLESVSFSGQSISIKGVSCTVTKGLITSNDVTVSVDVDLSDAVKFAIDDFDYNYSSGFSGGTFNLEKAEIKYKDFDLIILETENQTDKAKFSAKFAIPESSGYANVDNIYISLEDGVDFSQMNIDYGSLPNLLPTGFKLTVNEFEAINDGILFSGSMELLGSSVNVEGLKVSPSGIDINELDFHTPSFKLGSYSMPNLDFAFSKSGNDWEIDISGKADIPDVGSLDFSGYVKSNGDFGGQLVLQGASIPLGESGFALYNPGGSIQDSSGIFTVKLFGDFAPEGMNYVYVLHGELSVSSSGVITGSTEGKLFNMITLQKSYCSIDLAHGKLEYDTDFSYGIKTPPKTTVIKKVDAVTQQIPTIELMGYGGGVNVSTWTGVEISGSGNCVLIGVQVGTIDLDIDDKHFEFYANFHVPNPGGGPDLVSCTGSVNISYDEGAGELSGSAAVLGHDLVAMDFNFSPDQMGATAAVNLAIAQFNVDFQATKDNGKYKLDYFHGDAYIGYESMTFADMTLDIDATSWSGSAHAWVPGFGSEIDITIQGTPNKVTYFDGYEAFRVFNIQLEEAEFKYQDVNNKKYISFDAHGSLPHFGRSSFSVEMQKSGSHWVLYTLDGEVDAYIDINLPVFGHWHKELGKATIDYNRSQGKLVVDLHTTLLNVGIVRLTDLYGIVYFHEPSATVGVKGHYGLGKHTYHLWKLHCHYHFCCHGGCSWEKCCYWTVNLGDKYFDVHVKVKGPSLPAPKKEVPKPAAPKVIVENCDVDHIHSGQVCTNTNYNNVTFNKKSLSAVQFSGGKFQNSTFKNTDLSNAIFSQVNIDKLYFNNTKLDQTQFKTITSAQTFSFTNNTSLDGVKIEDSKIKNMTIKSLDINGLSISNTTLTQPSWQNLNFNRLSLDKLTVTGIALKHVLFDKTDIENSTFSDNTFDHVTIKGGSQLNSSLLENVSFNNCNLDSVTVNSSTSFTGSHFSQTVLQDIDFTGNENLKNLTIDNNSTLVNVDLTSADISGSSITGADLGKVTLDQTTANNVHFTNVSFAGTQMDKADFSENVWTSVVAHKSDISSVNFRKTLFNNTDLSLSTVDKNTKFTHSTFANTNLHGIDFSNNAYMDSVVIYGNCDLQGVKFIGANLKYAVFYGVRFHKTDFSQADLSNARFYFCEFDTVNFHETNLSATLFYQSRFTGHTDFHSSMMVGTDLRFIGTNFENTNLAGVNFTNANLTGLNLTGSVVDFCNFTGANLTNVNLKGTFSRPQTMLEFDGTDDYVELPMNGNHFLDYNPKAKTSYSAHLTNSTRLEIMIDEPETNITHEFWFKTSSSNAGLFSVEAFDKEQNKGHDRHIYLKNGNIYARVWSNEIINSSGKNYADGNWHHIAHVIGTGASGQKIYVDGNLVASGSKSGSDFNWQDRILIGYSEDAGSKYLNGYIDEVRIWRSTLSADVIKKWKDKPATLDHPNYEELVVYLPFDKGSGKVAINKAFPGIVSNWHKMSSRESFSNLTPKRFAHGPSIQFDKELTIETWAKSGTSNWNDDAVLVNKREGFFFHPVKNSRDIHFWYRNSKNQNHNVGSFTPANISSGYHHLAVTFGKGQVKFYEDGNLMKTISVSQDNIIIDKSSLNLGIDDLGGRKHLNGNMINTRVWDKVLTQKELSASKGKYVITPLDTNFKHLKLQVKDLSLDKATYAFNAYFNKNWELTDGSWNSSNAPINYTPVKNSTPFTVELNVMPAVNNTEKEVLFQQGKQYNSSNGIIKAAVGYQIVREDDQKVSFRIYRRVRQKTTDQSVGHIAKFVDKQYVDPVEVREKVTWNYTLEQLEEHNMAFHITPGSPNFKVELLINGESKGRKNLNVKSFFAEDKKGLFPQTESWMTNASSFIGAGLAIEKHDHTSEEIYNGTLVRDDYYKGYLYDLRVWNSLVDASVLQKWHRLDIDPTHPNFNDLVVNYTMADGAPEIQNHGYQVSKTVHYGDYIRLKHRGTDWELCSFKRPFKGQQSSVGDMVVGMNTTNHTAYWRVMPGNPANLNNVKGQVVKSTDQISLYNPYNSKYLSVANRKATHDRSLQEVVGTANAHAWKLDSVFTADSTDITSHPNLQWGYNLILNDKGNYYLSSHKLRFKDGSTDLYQSVGGSQNVTYNEIWQIDEVVRSYNFNRMFSKSDNMPVYITLPNFDAATLKNTTMPDGTIKN